MPFVALVVGLLLCLLPHYVDADAVSPEPGCPWDYLNLPGWALCGPLCATGSRQSPINLVAAVQYPQMGSISYSTLGVDPLLVWSNTSYTLIGTNNAANGSFSITGGPMFSDRYNLLSYHFHSPAEHTKNGKQYPFEVHFVHQQPATGQLSVIGILFDWSDRDNPLLEELWGHNPSQPTGQVRPYALIDSVLQGGYFHYVGSLTTPPCSEDVLWLMLQTDSTISHAQMDRWKYRTPSNRPIQSNPGTLWAVSAGRKA